MWKAISLKEKSRQIWIKNLYNTTVQVVYSFSFFPWRPKFIVAERIKTKGFVWNWKCKDEWIYYILPPHTRWLDITNIIRQISSIIVLYTRLISTSSYPQKGYKFYIISVEGKWEWMEWRRVSKKDESRRRKRKYYSIK